MYKKSYLLSFLLCLTGCVSPASIPSTNPTPLPTPSLLTPSSPTPRPSGSATPAVAATGLALQIPINVSQIGFAIASKVQIELRNCSTTDSSNSGTPALKPCTPESVPLFSQAFEVDNIKEAININLKDAKVGDVLEFKGSGHDRGNCNNITSTQRLTLTEIPFTLKNINWISTDLACIFKLTLSGKILDTAGQPIFQAQIEALSQNSAVPYQQKTSSNSDGSYELIDLPEGIVIEIKVSKSGYLLNTLKGSFTPTDPRVSEVRGIDFTLSPQF
jgi:hypothetical protein